MSQHRYFGIPYFAVSPFHYFFSITRKLLALLILAAGCAEAAELTLPDAIRLALENNPDLRASRGKADAALGQADQAGRWSNPELQLSLEDWPLRGAGWSSSKRIAGISQALPFPGKKRLDRQIGNTVVRLSQADLALRRIETVRDVKVAFFQVLAAQSLMNAGGELLKTAEVLASAANKRVEAGSAPEQERLRAEIPLEKSRMDLADFQRELVITRRTLASLLGRPELGDTTLVGSLEEAVNPALLDRYSSPDAPNYPSRLAAVANVARAELAVRRARLEILPDVTVGIGAGREAITNNSIGEIRIGVPLPIFDNSSGKRREARANLAVTEAEFAAVELRLAREWNLASGRMRVASDQVRAYRDRILPKANEALHRIETGFHEGKFILADVLETQRTASEARLAYQQKLLELNIARAELEALAGKLN